MFPLPLGIMDDAAGAAVGKSKAKVAKYTTATAINFGGYLRHSSDPKLNIHKSIIKINLSHPF